MKLILFGGAEIEDGQVEQELKMIERVIKHLKTKQLLHVPFARTIAHEIEWNGNWFRRNIHVPGLQYLNAGRSSDIAKARSPLIFISGGSQHVNLVDKVRSNPRLLRLIKNADTIIGESAGSMFVCDYFRTGRAEGRRRMLKALGILKKTVIEPHYTERQGHNSLVWQMKGVKAKYGIGIDCLTALECDTGTFPKRYKVLGKGGVELRSSIDKTMHLR